MKKVLLIPIITGMIIAFTGCTNSKYLTGSCTEYFSGATYELNGDNEVSLDAWGYLFLVK